jgi:hypothetical protein
MRTTTTALTLALASSVLPACGGCDSVPDDAVQDCQAALLVPGTVQTDILFVIDDSGSMSEEQANLAANLGAFVDALAASPVENDFRIGVTTTAVEGFDPAAASWQAYDGGPSDGVPYPDGALVAVRQDAGGNGVRGALVYDAAAHAQTGGWGGARILEKGSATLARDFKANVLVGTAGSSKEQHFRAARLALSDRLQDANAGFLRDGARLAVIFVTDEDDCSDTEDPRATSNVQCHDDAVKSADPPVLDAPESFAAFLLGPVGGELREVMVGAIAGFDQSTLAPSCSDAALCQSTRCSTAFDGGDRLAALRTALGASRMDLGSICDASFHDALVRFAEALAPTTMPLPGAPADWRMLAVSVTRPDGSTVACALAEEGTPEQAAADAVYGPPRLGRPAQLTFQNGCRLGLGDRVDARVVCVR